MNIVLDTFCLAAMLFSEASIEPPIAQYEIAWTVRRRAAIEQTSICDQINKPTNDGRKMYHTRSDINWSRPYMTEYYKFAAEFLRGQHDWLGTACPHAMWFTHTPTPPKTIKPLRLCSIVSKTYLWELKHQSPKSLSDYPLPSYTQASLVRF